MSDIFNNQYQDAELFIGLVGLIGTNLDSVIERLRSEFSAFNYNLEVINLVQTLNQFPDLEHYLASNNFFIRSNDKMNGGNKIREITDRNDFLALISLSYLRAKRIEINSKKKNENNQDISPLRRYVYIFKSLKTPEEISLLREIYGSSFYVISVYSTRTNRKEYLLNKAKEKNFIYNNDPKPEEAEALITRDIKEENNAHGQNVNEAFHLADLFLNIDNLHQTTVNINRFIELIFGITFHTPSPEEYAIFHAQASAYRSSSFARQVGAAIANDDGKILALGTNEVPKAGGGQYWFTDTPNHQEITEKKDSSDNLRHKMFGDILLKLDKMNFLKDKVNESNVEKIVNSLLFDSKNQLIRKSQLMNVIEYGKCIHAEMSAILEGAKLGISLKDTIIYVTTFPCHECARHIVGVGIKKVIYIEPYPKSLVQELHPDSVDIEQWEQNSPSNHKVPFIPFTGIAPRQYLTLFKMSKRKDIKGEKITFDKLNVHPKIAESYLSYINKETQAIDVMNTIISKKVIKYKTKN